MLIRNRAMHRKHVATKIILLAVAIAVYAIVAGAAPTSQREVEKTGKTIENSSDLQDKVAQLKAEVAALEARLHKERHEFSKMGQNNYKIFQVDTEEISGFGNMRIDGDVNGDGFADLLISDCLWKNQAGRVFFFYGAKDIAFSSPDMIYQGESEGSWLGDQSGVFGDVNNDGYDDVIIGARGYSDYDGRVYVYYGGPGMDNVADVILDGEKGANGWFGLPVAAGDIDKDGYVDILVGAQNYNEGRGRVYLFWGGEIMDTTADVIFEGEGYPGGKPIFYPGYGMSIQDLFGRKIDASGDINGDGYNDILIGARHAGGQKSNGAAYLYLGNPKENMDAVCDYTFRGEDGDNMGSSLELFDIDNDGFSDVVVGSRYAKRSRGAVNIWWGGKDFDGSRSADIVLEGDIGSHMGGGDIDCGDFNNDNYGDILVGAAGYHVRFSRNQGRAYVFYGNNRTLMDTDCDYIFDPEEHTIYAGVDLSVGDVNKDGHLDALIGAYGGTDDCTGKAFLYFGPFATEDLQDKIKAQQKRVKEVEQQLSEAKQRLSSIEK